MKCSLALTSPLLLLLLLGSASTLPVIDQDADVPQFLPLDSNDDVVDLIPVQVDSGVYLVPVVHLVEEEQPEGGARRRKRHTTVSGGVNREDLGNGARCDSGNININHKKGPHNITGGVSVDRTKIPGFEARYMSRRSLKETTVLPSIIVSGNPIPQVDLCFTDSGVNAGYEWRRRNTAISVGVSHSRGSGGRATNVGISFTHTFGKK